MSLKNTFGVFQISRWLIPFTKCWAEILCRCEVYDDPLLMVQRLILGANSEQTGWQALEDHLNDLVQAWQNYMLAHPFLTSAIQAAICVLSRRLARFLSDSQNADSGCQDDADDKSLFQVSSDSDSDLVSAFDGVESPHHRAWKFPRLAALASDEQLATFAPQTFNEWMEHEKDAVNSMVTSLLTSTEPLPAPRQTSCSESRDPTAEPAGEPASSSSAVSESVRQPFLSKHRGQTFELKYMKSPVFGYEEIPRIYGGFTRSAGSWPDPHSESSSWKPFFFPRQKNYKWGGCPECPSRALTPVVVSDVSKWQGSIRLFCTGQFQKTISGFRVCLVSFPFDMEAFHLLPIDIRDEYQSVSMSLLRGASSA